MLRVLRESLQASCSDVDPLPSRFHELVAELVAQDSVPIIMKALLFDAAKSEPLKHTDRKMADANQEGDPTKSGHPALDEAALRQKLAQLDNRSLKKSAGDAGNRTPSCHIELLNAGTFRCAHKYHRPVHERGARQGRVD
jgi:hypothetical protein